MKEIPSISIFCSVFSLPSGYMFISWVLDIMECLIQNLFKKQWNLLLLLPIDPQEHAILFFCVIKWGDQDNNSEACGGLSADLAT